MSPPPMSGRFCALKAARISAATTARLIAPTTTGLRSRNGHAHPRQHLSGAGVVVAPGWSGRRRGDLALELAEVEVEPRAVDRGPADLLELDGQHLQGPVELGLVAVEVVGDRAQLLDVLDEGLADALDEVGGLDGQRGDLVERAEDRLAVVLQPADEGAER